MRKDAYKSEAPKAPGKAGKQTLTDPICRAAKTEGKACNDIGDLGCPGLLLRVTPDRKSWAFNFTIPGTRTVTKIRLGTYAEFGGETIIGLSEARKGAEKARDLVRAGKDPRAAAAPVVAAEAPKTISDLIDMRLQKKVTGRIRTADEVTRRYNTYIRPLIGHVAVVDFDPTVHYAAVFNPLWDAGTECMAGMVHRDMFALFRFAVNRIAGVKFNMMSGVENEWKYTPCDRDLSDAEIATLWSNIPRALAGSPVIQRIVKLLLATGQRVGEICKMTRSQIDEAEMMWTIPAQNSKNGHKHIIPINRVAWALIKEAMDTAKGQFLFPLKSADRARFSNDVSTRVALARDLFGIEYWTPHDLRHTVANQLVELDVDDAHISLVLNHRSETHRSVTQKVYKAKKTHIPQKRRAVDLWGEHLAKLVGFDGPVSNVIPMKVAA